MKVVESKTYRTEISQEEAENLIAELMVDIFWEQLKTTQKALEVE